MNSVAGPITITAIASSTKAVIAVARRWAKTASRSAPQSIGLRPASSSSASQSAAAATNQASPGMLKVNTAAAASSTPTTETARQPARSRPARAIAKASTNSAIAVSLKALWARNDAAR